MRRGSTHGVNPLAALRAAREADDDDVEILIRVKRSEFLQYVDQERQLAVVDAQPKAAATWREKLWHAPPQTRLYMSDLQEALGRSRRWIQTQTKKPDDPLPHRKELDGRVAFLAGEVRAWCERTEVRIA